MVLGSIHDTTQEPPVSLTWIVVGSTIGGVSMGASAVTTIPVGTVDGSVDNTQVAVAPGSDVPL